MPIKRRVWLKLFVFAAALAAVGVLSLPRRVRIKLRAITARERAAVARIVDLLVPADAGAPGAAELGVHSALLEDIAANRWDSQYLAEGVLWLDEQALAADGAAFLGVGRSRQIALLERMQAEPAGSVPARAFRRLRDDTMTLYYSRPESWPSLGFGGPPQPLGFPDHAEPPRPRSS